MFRILLIIGFYFFTSLCYAQNYFAATGNDSIPGTLTKPLKSIQIASDMLKVGDS